MNTTDKKRDKVSVFYEEMEKLTGCKIFRDLLRKESPVVADVIWNSMRTYADRQVAAALSSGGSNCIKELKRRQQMIISEREGIVRESMINNLLVDLDLESASQVIEDSDILKELYDEVKALPHYTDFERISRTAVLAKIKLRMKSPSPKPTTESDAIKVLKELVELKDMKVQAEMIPEYVKREALAWAAARKLIESKEN